MEGWRKRERQAGGGGDQLGGGLGWSRCCGQGPSSVPGRAGGVM